MLENVNIENILFIDIETVPEYPLFSELSPEKQQLFALKTAYQRRDDYTPEQFYDRAGIWAEFGKIVCISAGFFTYKRGVRQFRVTSFHGEEKQLLKEFSNLLNGHFSLPQHVMCGHNVKEFDFPFMGRRMVINQMPIPEKLNLIGKKPWEIQHLDTLELWKFGDYKHFTSLKLLTNILNIPSPKDDIDGSQVAKVYYEEKDIDRIITYCEKDVLAVAQILLRFKRQPLLNDTEVFSV